MIKDWQLPWILDMWVSLVTIKGRIVRIKTTVEDFKRECEIIDINLLLGKERNGGSCCWGVSERGFLIGKPKCVCISLEKAEQSEKNWCCKRKERKLLVLSLSRWERIGLMDRRKGWSQTEALTRGDRGGGPITGVNVRRQIHAVVGVFVFMVLSFFSVKHKVISCEWGLANRHFVWMRRCNFTRQWSFRVCVQKHSVMNGRQRQVSLNRPITN